MSSEVDKEKFKTLYEYQRHHFDIVKSHYEKLEDKATKYLTYVSIFITAFSLLAKYYFIDETVKPNIFFYFTSFYSLLTFILLCQAFDKLFSCLQVKEVFQVNTSSEMIKYFEDNKRESVYLGLAHHYKNVIQSYIEKNNEKAELLQDSFRYIKNAGGSLVVMIVLVILGKLLG